MKYFCPRIQFHYVRIENNQTMLNLTRSTYKAILGRWKTYIHIYSFEAWRQLNIKTGNVIGYQANYLVKSSNEMCLFAKVSTYKLNDVSDFNSKVDSNLIWNVMNIVQTSSDFIMRIALMIAKYRKFPLSFSVTIEPKLIYIRWTFCSNFCCKWPLSLSSGHLLFLTYFSTRRLQLMENLPTRSHLHTYDVHKK